MARTLLPIIVLDPATGNAISGATVTVTYRDTGSAASVYASESGGSNLGNTLTTNSNGRVGARWVERGAYNLVVSGTGITTYTEAFDAAPAGDGTVDSSWIGSSAVDTAELAGGAVTLPKLQVVPHALVTRTTTQSITSSVETTVALTSTTTDTGSASGYSTMVDGAGSVFARVAGLYYIEGAVQFEDPTGASIGRRQLSLRRVRSGTTTTLRTAVLVATTNDFTFYRLDVSTVITAQVGDQFYLSVNHSQTAALDIIANGTADTQSPVLSITYLGRVS